MKVGDYVRLKGVIMQVNSISIKPLKKAIKLGYAKTSPNITDLLKTHDLLYIDIDNGYEGGIIVPRIPETLNELNNYIKKIKSGELILKGVVTREQLMERMFEVNK